MVRIEWNENIHVDENNRRVDDLMKQVEQGKLQRILFVPTGALLSTVSFNEGKTVPGIAHGVVIEHAD